MLAGHAGEGAREEQSQARAGRRADEPGDGALAQEQRADLAARGAERAQNSDLAAPLRDRDGEGVIDDEHPDEEREHAGNGHRQGVDAEQGFELPAAAGGRLHGEAGTEQLARGRPRPAPA